MNNNIIEVSNVSKSFKEVKVFDKVNLTVKKGEICGLVGLNGSGKTVLMKIISGLLTPDEGTVFVDGKQIGKDIDFPENIGIIIENPGFMPYTTGLKNLQNLASIKRTINKSEIIHYLKLVGLNPAEKKWVKNYSLGMKQRLAIAQAIMENQEILLLDEPFNSLDKNGVKEMREVLLNLKTVGKTIVIASHNQSDIDILCSKVYEIDNGHIQEVTK